MTAIISPQDISKDPAYDCAPTVIVNFSGVVINALANKNSPQTRTREYTVTAPIPGEERGNIIEVSILKVEQPSILADSSTPFGIPSIKLFRVQIVNGKMYARFDRIIDK